jgi:uncharacterized membrane protein required for colicin V production
VPQGTVVNRRAWKQIYENQQMDWSLIIFLVVVVFFAYRGYKKGLLKSLSRVSSLVAGYITAILYTGSVSTFLGPQFQLQGIAAFVIASLVLFFGAAMAVSLLFRLGEKLWSSEETPSSVSSFGGATLGLVVGVIVATVIVWTYAFVRDMRPTETVEVPAEINYSRVESMARRAVGKAVNTAMSLGSAEPQISSLSTALAEAPAEIAQHAQQLASSNDLNTLLNNPKNQAVLNGGDVEAVLKLPAFQQLANNPDMLALAKSAGILNESADNRQSAKVALAGQIIDIRARMLRMKNDRRVQEILADPEFQKKIQSGNPLDLLTNAPLLELADIIFSDSAAPAETVNNETSHIQPDSGLIDLSKEKFKLYSWTDKDGQIHYSDVEPEP